MAIHTLGYIIFGAYFVYSGLNHFMNEKMLTGYAKSKGIPSPRLAVLLTGAMMIFGGLGFLFQMYTQQAAMLLVIFLVPTTFAMHSFWKITDPTHKMGEMVNFMKNLALIGALLMFL
ncbi:MAG: DoxX family protein [Patescibacteria group bacterium]|nr:DoxX family protein [Patescibacteria group bacterium]